MKLKKIISVITALTLAGGMMQGISSVFYNEDIVSLTTVSAAQDNYSKDTKGFVTRMYNVVLGRNPDAAGLQNWTNKLNNHTASAADIITGFFFSSEYSGKKKTNEEMVTDCYNAMLNRGPDSQGMTTWKSRLDTGMSIQSVCKGFVGSNEFKGLCSEYGINPGNITLKYARDENYERTNFVYRLYKNCLGRTPDTAGLENWCKNLKNGMTGSQAAYGFIFSNEYKGKNTSDYQYVNMMYETMLGRTGDEAGVNNWWNKLNNYFTREYVFNGFLMSNEFKAQCSKAGISVGSKISDIQILDVDSSVKASVNSDGTIRIQFTEHPLTITLPANWKGKFVIRKGVIYAKKAFYNGDGKLMSFMYSNSKKGIDGITIYLGQVGYSYCHYIRVTDVRFNLDNKAESDEYMELSRDIEKVLRSAECVAYY